MDSIKDQQNQIHEQKVFFPQNSIKKQCSSNNYKFINLGKNIYFVNKIYFNITIYFNIRIA